MDFVDLCGASGQVYRFRAWPISGQHPAIAGNYVVLHAQTLQMVEVGVLDNLAEARIQVGTVGPTAKLYTRLNVSRAQREADHADLAAAHAGAPHSA